MEPRNPTHADFAARIGEAFEAHVGEHRVSVRLDLVEALPESGREGGSFRLEFVGPPESALGQGIFPFLFGDERFDLFVVPVGHDAGGIRYEAIFF